MKVKNGDKSCAYFIYSHQLETFSVVSLGVIRTINVCKKKKKKEENQDYPGVKFSLAET